MTYISYLPIATKQLKTIQAIIRKLEIYQSELSYSMFVTQAIETLQLELKATAAEVDRRQAIEREQLAEASL
jgi:hypothetical protein